MNKHHSTEDLLEIINRALDAQGLSARRASILATGTPELIRNMRRGRIPSVERFRALCDVLNLEFYVGPIRLQKSASTRAFGKEKAMSDMLEEIISRLPPRETRRKTAEPTAPYKALKSGTTYRVPVFEPSVGVAKVPTGRDKQRASYISFQKSWFEAHNLNPEHCVIIQVSDNSMEPTIANHSVVLVDRSRCRKRVGHIYAIRIGDNIVIKRLAKSKDAWRVVGDHQKERAAPLPLGAEIIGEVKWAARTFD